MLTQEQANQMTIAQNQLEQAQLSYNALQNKINSYEKILNEVSSNYNSYTPEQKAKIDGLLPQLSEQYNQIKKQKQDQFLAQYDAQQQIDYYNRLNAEQSAAANTAGQRRRVVTPTPVTPEPVPTTPEVSSNYTAPQFGYTWSPAWNYSNPWQWQNGQQGWVNYDLPGRVSTANWPRFVGRTQNTNTQPEQYATPIIEMVGWMSTVDWPRKGYIWGNVSPVQYATPITEMVGWMSTVDWPRRGYIWGNNRPVQYATPVTDATLPGWVSTANWPRFVG